MDKFEFTLRFMWYEWLSERFNLNFDQKTLIQLTKKTDKWKLTKKLQETSPDELKELTLQTYTDFKKQFIKKYSNKKIKKNWTLADYINRLEYEYNVINQMWYNTYFLIVQDYIMYAKKNKIVVWPGRWSAAWSLLSYLIRITEIDPLEYDLLFERFLNPARISMPDVDTDFEDAERDKILEYVKNKYWIENVAQIWTYMTMAAKAAFKDVARTFGISFTKANKLSSYIEKSIIKSYEENEEFKQIVDNDKTLQEVVKLSARLEWTVRQVWVHACWVVICPTPIQDRTPVQYPPKSWQKNEVDATRIITQYDWHYLEDIGLLKMDFLGLRNLSIIKNTIKILKAKSKKEWKKLDKIYEKFFEYMVFEPPLDDKKTLNLFCEGNTSGVFQFESDGMRNWLKHLKPSCIDDIVAMVALYRPWPMEWIPNYIDRKNWKEKVEYLPAEIYNKLAEKYWKEEADKQKKMITEDLSGFMNITYGIPIYQEQLMRIVQAMAWFSLWEADLLRRWVGKKIKEIIDKLKKEFITRAAEYRWYKEEVTTFVYEKMIEPAANYSFNKSHAVCYAIIAYQTAFLKAHHPVEFHAALLRSVEENTEKMASLIDELKFKWFDIVPPSVNISFAHIAAVENKIVIGLIAIKGLWYDVSKFIEQEREKNGKFTSLENFLTRCEKIINKKSLEALAKSGSLDAFAPREQILENTEKILNRLKQLKDYKQTVSMSLFGDEFVTNTSLQLAAYKPVSIMKKLAFEYETLWTFVSSHPFDGLYKYIKSKFNLLSQIHNENFTGKFSFLGIVKNIRKNTKTWWFWITVEDVVDTIDIYLKSIWNLKLFDVIVVRWTKDKRISVSEIEVVNLDKLIEKVKRLKKFDEKQKVYIVRAERNKDKQEKKPIIETESCSPDQWCENLHKAEDNELAQNEEMAVEEGWKIDSKTWTVYKEYDIDFQDTSWSEEEKKVIEELPEDINILLKIIEIKKKNPDLKEVEVEGKIYKIK